MDPLERRRPMVVHIGFNWMLMRSICKHLLTFLGRSNKKKYRDSLCSSRGESEYLVHMMYASPMKVISLNFIKIYQYMNIFCSTYIPSAFLHRIMEGKRILLLKTI